MPGGSLEEVTSGQYYMPSHLNEWPTMQCMDEMGPPKQLIILQLIEGPLYEVYMSMYDYVLLVIFSNNIIFIQFSVYAEKVRSERCQQMQVLYPHYNFPSTILSEVCFADLKQKRQFKTLKKCSVKMQFIIVIQELQVLGALRNNYLLLHKHLRQNRHLFLYIFCTSRL